MMVTPILMIIMPIIREVQSLRSISFLDAVSESPHAKVKTIMAHSRRQTWGWTCSTHRLEQNLLDVEQLGPAVTTFGLQQEWGRFASVIQCASRRTKQSRNKRLSRRALESKLYTMDKFVSFQRGCAKPEGPPEMMAIQDGDICAEASHRAPLEGAGAEEALVEWCQESDSDEAQDEESSLLKEYCVACLQEIGLFSLPRREDAAEFGRYEVVSALDVQSQACVGQDF